jgi:TonB family protein
VQEFLDEVLPKSSMAKSNAKPETKPETKQRNVSEKTDESTKAITNAYETKNTVVNEQVYSSNRESVKPISNNSKENNNTKILMWIFVGCVVFVVLLIIRCCSDDSTTASQEQTYEEENVYNEYQDIDQSQESTNTVTTSTEDNNDLIFEENDEDNSDYDVVEEMPEFPGGASAMMMYLAENIKYPTAAQERGAQGRVIVKFVIDKNGNVVEPVIVRSVDPDLDKEALRVVRSMPRWKPGMQRNKIVRVKYTVPVTFRLQ